MKHRYLVPKKSKGGRDLKYRNIVKQRRRRGETQKHRKVRWMRDETQKHSKKEGEER